MKLTLRCSPGAHGFVAALFCALLAPAISAQSYPSKPVRIIVPVGAGGATDILSRALAQRLSAFWGQQVVVDNRPGGGSNVGFEEIIDRLNADFTRALASPDVIQTLNASGLEPVGRNTPEEFTAYLRAEISKWAKVVQTSGAKAD